MPICFGVEMFDWREQDCYTKDTSVFFASAETHDEFRIVSLVPYADLMYVDLLSQYEYIDNYLWTLQTLAGQDMYDIRHLSDGVTKAIPISRLAIPCVYLSCHVIELAIKRALRCQFGDNVQGHDLSALWCRLRAYLYDSKFVTVSSYFFLDAMNNFVLFMAAFSEKHNTRYRYAYGKNGLSQTDPEYINVPRLVRTVESFVGQLGILGESVLHSGERRNKVAIQGSGAKMEDWSFGCSNKSMDQGFYLCEAICHVDCLSFHAFSAVVNSKVYHPDMVPAITHDYLASMANDGRMKYDLEWYCEFDYCGQWIQFYGRRSSLTVCINYDVSLESDMDDIMMHVWNKLKTMAIPGLTS